MQSRRDAFGHALSAFLQGEPSISIIERKDGYFDTDDISMYFAPFSAWPAHQRKAMRYVKGRVLDVGCGAGRHALYLQSKGISVVGMDESPLAIRVCRARGLKDTRVLRVTRVSPSLGAFQTVLMMGNNLGLLGGFNRARWLLRKLAGITTADGRIIGEGLNPNVTRRRFHKEYQRSNRQAGRMPGQIRMRLRYQAYVTSWFDYLLLSPTELRQIVANTDWHVSRLIRSDGPLYVAVLKKN